MKKRDGKILLVFYGAICSTSDQSLPCFIKGRWHDWTPFSASLRFSCIWMWTMEDLCCGCWLSERIRWCHPLLRIAFRQAIWTIGEGWNLEGNVVDGEVFCGVSSPFKRSAIAGELSNKLCLNVKAQHEKKAIAGEWIDSIWSSSGFQPRCFQHWTDSDGQI